MNKEKIPLVSHLSYNFAVFTFVGMCFTNIYNNEDPDRICYNIAKDT